MDETPEETKEEEVKEETGGIKNQGVHAILARWSIVLVVLAIAIIVVYFNTDLFTPERTVSEKLDYVIPGVPAVNIYSDIISNTPIRTIPAASLYSIFKYWSSTDEEIDVEKLAFDFFHYNRPFSLTDMGKYAIDLGYVVRYEKLDSIEKLKQYINPGVRTPLIFHSARNDDVTDTRARVLIGILESEQKVVFHDYYKGNNFEMSFDEYNRLIKINRSEKDQYWFLVIQPQNPEEVLASMPEPEPYPERTELMNSVLPQILNDVGRGVTLTDDPYTQIFYLKRAIDHPEYETLMAKHWQVFHWSFYAEQLLRLKRYDEAKEAIDIAMALNHDLDIPEPGWPSYPIKELHDPWRVLGEYYGALASIEGDPLVKADLQVKADEAHRINVEKDFFKHDSPH